MSLVYWDQENSLLKAIRMTGDLLKYVVSIIWHNVETGQEVLRMAHSDGNQLLVTTPKEKLLVYMYKERDNYQSLLHPGLRYLYYRRSWADNWTKINEGSLAVSKVRIVQARPFQGSTYKFDV